MVALAGLYNALKVIGKKPDELKVGMIGAGSAGNAIAKLLNAAGFGNLVVFDSKGALFARDDLESTSRSCRLQ